MGPFNTDYLTEVRKRNVTAIEPIQETNEINDDIVDLKKQKAHTKASFTNNDATKHKLAFTTISAMSIFTTFYKIWYPAQVVFDEVHFGKFAGFYLQRTYFFDVHPPLAKLMLAAVGYMIGFNGIYQFSNIGESYAKHQVPYIVLRAFPAFLNVLSVGLAYHILKQSGYSVLTCFTVATLYALDNGFIAQNRLILLDSILIFYMLTAIYSYIRFRKLRHAPFSKGWWGWLIATGVCMSLTLSVKMVGLFLFVAIGALVIKDMWDLLDLEKHGWSSKKMGQYFFAHVFGLLFVPIAVYLFWFYVHFSILIYSGPGNHLMSNRFQDTLENSQIGLNSLDIMYNQSIRLQHKDTGGYLHGSGDLRYPTSYEDGRRSSKGLLVTGTKKAEEASYWRIVPAYWEVNNTDTPVKNNDVIQLVHAETGLRLLTHDVAAPLIPMNQEFTLTENDNRFNETLFRVLIDKDRTSKNWSTLMNSVRLVHLKTNVAMWCNSKKLPAWGHKHLEVNGNKDNKHFTNYWIATDILGINATEVNLEKYKNKKIEKMKFFEKFVELQLKMLEQNNKLSTKHPYQSRPHSWPLMLRGISYWSNNEKKEQIYMTGNVVGWWIGLLCLFLFAGISIVDKALLKRKVFMTSEATRNRFNRTGGFFLLLWITHYIPFYAMGRTLYLHHYLPAMACNYLLIGSVFEFMFVEGVNSPISLNKSKHYNLTKSRTTIKSYIAAIVLISLQFMVYLYLSPMTYGTPGLTSEEAYHRKILNSWDVRYAKFISDM